MAGTVRRRQVRSAQWLALVLVLVVACAVVVTIVLTSGGDRSGVRTAPRDRPATVDPTLAGPDGAGTDGDAATGSGETRGGARGELAALRVAAPRTEGYDRDLFGGDWTDADGDCRDTRAEVLAAQSRVAVTYTSAAACTVATGEWVDPWSGAVSTSARALDVDHTVPLANAWRSGAWAWTAERRLAFANDLAAPGHLLAIPLGENRAKGDDGPEGWRPPARASWCNYAQLWASIKARWDLSATPAEWAALQEMAATC
ncbi:MAG: HNH endonuclease [Actinobacteria bacterium]|nr:HNH endonuclease [Actinomycetota bacterium]